MKAAVEDRVLADWELNNGQRLRLRLLHHKRRQYLDIRRWFTAADGSLQPTTKGIRLDSELAGPLAELLTKVSEGHYDD